MLRNPKRWKERAMEARLAPLVAALDRWAKNDPEAIAQEQKELAAKRRRRQLKRSKKVPRQMRPPRL